MILLLLIRFYFDFKLFALKRDQLELLVFVVPRTPYHLHLSHYAFRGNEFVSIVVESAYYFSIIESDMRDRDLTSSYLLDRLFKVFSVIFNA